FDKSAANNPGNQVFRLQDRTDYVELRPEIDFYRGAFTLDLSPRLRWTRELVETRPGGRESEVEWDAEIAYFTATYDTDFGRIQAGRYVNLWGSSMFVSPSNPFHPDSGQSSPYIELDARDYVEASYSLSSSWSSRIIFNFDEGAQEYSGADDPVGIVTADYFGDTLAASALAEVSEDWWGIGGYGQWTPNEAVVIYGDGIVRRGPRPIPVATGTGLARDPDDEWSLKALGGAAYSFKDGTTVSLEYLFNSAGYDDDEAARAFALHESGIAPSASSAARAGVRALAEVPFLDLRRNYLLGRLSRTSLIWEDVDLNVLYAHGVDDGSGRFVANADWFVSDNGKLFFNTTVFHGGEGSEFGRFVETQLTVGIRWSLF
ncbi:MAG TPA: hypothetical protein VK943_10850, partial [Arenibaculum sp.]|nr:hypothetical protein [Arenibaculum sp.]